MKKFALAAVLATAASTSFAGGLNAPVVEEVPVLDSSSSSATSSSAGWVIPVLLLAIVAAAAAS